MDPEPLTKARIKAYSISELARLYEVDRRTLKKWISPWQTMIGQRKGHFYTIVQVRIIFKKIGRPRVTTLHLLFLPIYFS